MNFPASVRCALATGMLFSFNLSANAAPAPILIDDFSSPTPAQNIIAPSQNWVTSTPGTFAGVANQFRDAYYYPYYPTTDASGYSATIGAGAVKVQAPTGGAGELGLGYGAYGVDFKNPHSQGPSLNLDLSAYNDLRLQFASMETSTNIVVGFYTASPIANSGPLYYWDGEITVAPTVAGGPETVDLLFKGANQYANPPADPNTFNFAHVDGFVVIIDRATSATGNGYSLSNLAFTSAVAEPETFVLFAAGLSFMACVKRKRA